jgi:hypothetical protein
MLKRKSLPFSRVMIRMLALGELFVDFRNEDQYCPVFMVGSRVDVMWKW